jgi:hypothetical protein
MNTTPSTPTHDQPRLVRPWLTKCCVCGRKYENGCGSTECCGSIQEIFAYGATVSQAIGGSYAKFERGELVWARKGGSNTYTVERREWKVSKVELANVLCGVPGDLLSWPNA